MFFGKGSKRGVGVISDPKNYIADFVGFKAVYFGRKFWKKCPTRGRGGHLQSKTSEGVLSIFEGGGSPNPFLGKTLRLSKNFIF